MASGEAVSTYNKGSGQAEIKMVDIAYFYTQWPQQWQLLVLKPETNEEGILIGGPRLSLTAETPAGTF